MCKISCNATHFWNTQLLLRKNGYQRINSSNKTTTIADMICLYGYLFAWFCFHCGRMHFKYVYLADNVKIVINQ